ncbi:hypothetical protein ASPVEDRAFT_759249 [Aspergillus versicolor CBS 583.65]|uniref:Uncharacterized protein n=1 Tax=Aspergillus versicolor CBS 583.65 TaxID=1036611 RepID=A0A1L9PQT5_ASPVE|nr:uncharacterized protein ASPVEDRAFT_759249 [Aspergillus versicolor CBS 583.65]OJJ03816.1 hypothetical protein ASPVEDRAFT_759249 [Aspergillus versicolor CBS 583.65]
MHRHHQRLHHHGQYAEADSAPLEPIVIPEVPGIVKRAPMPTAESGSTERCEPGDNSARCEKNTSTTNNTVLPVVLGAVIPIVCAIIVLYFLHRRNLKKLRNEDANDKHKSLDFGLDLPAGGGRPGMHEKDGTRINHMKGVSLDIGHSPYMMPPDMRGSRDSMNSLPRSVLTDDDKYRRAHQYFSPDTHSIRSQRRGHEDTASIAGSTRRGAYGDDMNQGLLGNAQRISRSSPPLYNAPSEPSPRSSANQPQVHDASFELNLPRSPSPVHVPGLTSINELATESPTEDNAPAGAQAQLNSRPEHEFDFVLRDTASAHTEPNPAPLHDTSIPTPRISFPSSDGASDYGDERASSNVPMPPLPEEPPQQSNMSLDPRRDTRRLTMGLRPLPPEDPADNPEQRANRIRSFYKEYFDESKAGQRETYYEDYEAEYYPYEDEYVYDPVTGEYYDAFPAPYAEPVTRRAMTPPPRAPPRFQGGPRHMASGSIGGYSEQFYSPGPRAFSSASARFPGARGPRKPAPPPAPLTVLPTPHLLKDDAIMTAIDFAPGSSFRDQKDGRPETPLGGVRPYSPMVRAHTPLTSVFDDLAPMPSPHQLRKSGAFDNLDFAPPPRFKTQETASDAGSIRSTRTGVSAAHLNNIRTGAYRVSRLPPETVGTRDDLMSNLRPTWDMRQ